MKAIKNYEIEAILMKAISLQEVHVTGDNSYTKIIAISAIFDGIPRVKQQQIIYTPLMKYILDHHIHALSIKTYTPQEWVRDRKLNGFCKTEI